MSSLESTLLNAYFDPIVGTPERAAALGQVIGTYVLTEASFGQNPFDALQDATKDIGADYVDNCPPVQRLVLEDGRFVYQDEPPAYAIHAVQVADLGLNTTVSALEAIGNIYKGQATELPRQEEGVVQQSVDDTLDYLHDIALLNKDIAFYARTGFLRGVSYTETSDITEEAEQRRSVNYPNGRLPVSQESFITTVDERGQLRVLPRHPLPARTAPGRCPATAVRVNDPNNRSGLRVMLGVLGNVAIHRIYPRMFGDESSS